MQSREQMVLRALRNLQILAAGQDPSAEDYAVVNDEIEPVLADLAQRGVWTWGDPDQIDDAAAVHLGIILANSVAPQFSRPQDEGTRLYAEQRLKELQPYIDAGDPVRAKYY